MPSILEQAAEEMKSIFGIEDYTIEFVDYLPSSILGPDIEFQGMCFIDTKTIYIRTRQSITLSLGLLCHEIVHAIQIKRGLLKTHTNRQGKTSIFYRGKWYGTNLSYHSQPWERDAYHYQVSYYIHFLSRCTQKLKDAISVAVRYDALA